MSGDYKVKVYVRHGYFQYTVHSMEKALAHAEAIMSNRTYRRSVGNDTVEVHAVYKVKVTGPNLGSEYPDEFMRT